MSRVRTQRLTARPVAAADGSQSQAARLVDPQAGDPEASARAAQDAGPINQRTLQVRALHARWRNTFATATEQVRTPVRHALPAFPLAPGSQGGCTCDTSASSEEEAIIGGVDRGFRRVRYLVSGGLVAGCHPFVSSNLAGRGLVGRMGDGALGLATETCFFAERNLSAPPHCPVGLDHGGMNWDGTGADNSFKEKVGTEAVNSLRLPKACTGPKTEESVRRACLLSQQKGGPHIFAP